MHYILMNWKDPDSEVPVRKECIWNPPPPRFVVLHNSQDHQLFPCKRTQEANLLSKKAVVSQNSWAQERRKKDSACGRLEAYEKEHNFKNPEILPNSEIAPINKFRTKCIMIYYEIKMPLAFIWVVQYKITSGILHLNTVFPKNSGLDLSTHMHSTSCRNKRTLKICLWR